METIRRGRAAKIPWRRYAYRYVVDYSDGAGEDVEERVHPDRLAKVFTARASAHRRWKKAIHAVRASLIIQKLGAAADSAGEAAAALAAETPPKAAEALMESPMKDSVACTAVHDFSAGPARGGNQIVAAPWR